jgi:hypothetical protein
MFTLFPLNTSLFELVRYAGTQDAAQCFCGDTPGVQAPETNCNSTCAGDNTQICGGEWRNSVYEVAPPTPAPTFPEYVGCFEDGEDRILDIGYTGSYDMTNQECVSYCASLSPPTKYPLKYGS